MPKVDRLKQKRELQRVRRALLNPDVRRNEQTNDTESRRLARTNPEVRQNEQTNDTESRRVARTNPEVRGDERISNTARMRDVRTNPVVRQNEQTNDTESRRLARTNSEVRQNEQTNDTERRRVARTQPDTREREAMNARSRRLKKTHEMACRYIPETGEFTFHQPCGQWNKPCIHNCGYVHLSSSTIGTRKKCCAGGKLSYLSPNCNHDLLEWFELRELPNFMQQAVSSGAEFSANSSTYNNLLAMGATKVCNYESTPGFTNRGPGNACVFLNGRVHHYLRAATSTDLSMGITYFIFDQIASLAISANARNVNAEILEQIGSGLRTLNPYCQELRMLGAEARARADGNAVIPRMPNQKDHWTVCAVVNNRQNGSMVIQMQTRNNNISSIAMDSPQVEPICFPLLFPHGENGWTNELKHELTAEAYMIARMLRPEKIGGTFMTAEATHSPYLNIDSRTGNSFPADEPIADIEMYSVPDESLHRNLNVNRFTLMCRLASYWCLDTYSRLLDQRLNALKNLRNRIMMGGTRKRSAVPAVSQEEEFERHDAGFSNPDESMNETYLPGSTHGSPRHMAGLAKNALVLVSEFGCPHVFLTLTCHPLWPEILAQLLRGQTAFDRPDITASVFKSRLDLLKANIRNGKYFSGSTVTYTFHVIEYQYRGLPHAHLVIRLTDAPDIDNPDKDALINFVNKHFLAEMPRFEGDENPNVFPVDGEPSFTEEYKNKCVELVRMHNTHKCAVAVNGCKKESTDKCKRGYSNTDVVSDTYINVTTNRIVYRRRMPCDLLIVPYNLEIMMDWDSHTNCEYSGSAYCALYMYKYCYKGAAKSERIALESEHGQDEIQHFILGRVLCSMSVTWRLLGYQDYPAAEPPVCCYKVRSQEQIKFFFDDDTVTDILVYYNRPAAISHLKYTEFLTKYNMAQHLPQFYQNTPESKDNISQEKHYFRIDMILSSTIKFKYVYVPVKKIARCIRIEMLYPTCGDIYYLRLILLRRAATSDIDVRTVPNVHGWGEPTVYPSYQQAAIAQGYVEGATDALDTYTEMSSMGTAAQVRSYFVVLTLHGYATHAIFDNYDMRRFMFMDYILYDSRTEEQAEQMMLQALERLFRKSKSSLTNYGFPKPKRVPTELEEAQLHWMNPAIQQQQEELLQQLNVTITNNDEQQDAFNEIMESIRSFSTSNREDLQCHQFHFIGGPGGTGKSALFKKLHAACRSIGLLISICAQSSLAALLFNGATTAHTLFGYPVQDEDDIDDQNLAQCKIVGEHKEFLHEVTVIFWDEFISNDRIIMEAVLECFKTLWNTPRYFVFVCAGDFAQV